MNESQTPRSETAPQDGRAPVPEPKLPVRALLRFSGELSTKARRTRARFQRRLVANLRDGLRAEGVEAIVRPDWSRFYIEAADDAFLPVVARTFGISSCSLVVDECEADLDRIVETGRARFAEAVRGRTFAVRARRSGTHPFSSGDIHRELGAALNPGATVDLGNPDVTVFLEVRDDRAYFYEDRVAGPDGLPLGVQGRAVALLSGGFDSAAAAWMALRRGVRLDYVFCNLGGAAYERMVVEVAKVLADRWSYGTRPRLHVVPFGPVVDAMRERAKPAYLQVVLKRLMYRAAAEIAAELRADAIVTGEAIGQVSSQTLRNLRAIDDASPLPVLRPLVGFNKNEILERCREIGTHDISARVREYCSVAPDRPVTASSVDEAAAQEALVGDEVLTAALAARRVLDLRSLAPDTMVGTGLYVSEVPAAAEVLDARSESAFEAWHWPGARRVDLDALESEFRTLGRDGTYLFYCEEGIRTAYLVELMQREGYEAYSFLGGAPRLRRLEAEALASGAL